MVTRRATSLDIPELVRLRLDAVSKANPLATISPDLAAATARYLTQNLPDPDRHRCWVADTGTSLVATALIIFLHRMPSLSNPTGLEGYVSNVYTEPAHRRAGLATSLLTMMAEDSKRAGVGRMWLYATDRSAAIYRRMGFSIVNRTEPEMEFRLCGVRTPN